MTQTLQDVESVCGSNAADFVASEGMSCFGSKAVAAIGIISLVNNDSKDLKHIFFRIS